MSRFILIAIGVFMVLTGCYLFFVKTPAETFLIPLSGFFILILGLVCIMAGYAKPAE